PAAAEDDHGRVLVASVRAYGDTLHTMVDRGAYLGPFLPGYEACEPERRPGRGMGLRSYDHVVANVEEHRLDDWVRWYEQVWGMRQLQHFTEQDITTAYSALRSTVVGNGGAVVLPVNEPAPGLRRSQIQEFLDYYRGPGVQHVALRTDDIIATVAAMQRRGIRFLRVPDTYYDEAPERMAGVQLPWRRLAELGILVDRDAGGYLLQVFTENVASRPTVFLEVIQRQGARGFGEGNFKALFTAIEAEQDRRGNL
ncbi:MAG TPA: 4-hydroxyphenylpyruvate dioxygenase, partial [Acidimicrobiales bacterium]|nr:4-hydroxyphenylpyruvate dioxygenase [Acidimicrobiales bacterium]